MKLLTTFMTFTLALAFTGMVLAQEEHHHGHDVIPADAPVPLFEGLGDHHVAITTSSETARAYFNQGLIFTYGFDHFEAVRSFTEATRHDPNCAMCYWGLALALGPHINAAMMPDAVAPAYEALQRAVELAPNASEREQAYIEALSARYVADPPEDRSDLDRAYADAMRELVQRYPDDLDALTLYAESLMNLTPWNYWAEGGEPRAETVGVIEALESVLAHDPYHPGATIMAVADSVLQGELALAQGEAAATGYLEQAVALQDSLPYMEPPFWFASARLNLGRALLALDRPEEAEAVYRADLSEYPNNGWALHGLAESLRAQGNADEAQEVERQVSEAWQHADTALATE